MQIPDDIYLGPENIRRNRIGSSSGNPTLQPGAGPMGRTTYVNVVPLTKQAASIAVLQAITAATAMSLAAGTGVTAAIAPDGSGRTVYQFDTPRCVSLTSGANLSAINVTIVGFDEFGQRMTQTRAAPNNTTVNTTKAFFQVLSVTPDGTSASTLSIGAADIFGLPFYCADAGYVMPKWNGALAQDAGTFVAGVTTTPSATTGDVRGTYAPSSAADGAKRLVIWLHLTAAQCGPTATDAGLYGQTQA